MKSKFQNRSSELTKLLDPAASLITVYGEAGIGKTRLLKEAVREMKVRSPTALVLWVDASQLGERSPQAQTNLLRMLIDHAEGRLSGTWTSVQDVVMKTVTQLNTAAQHEPVVLIFDNTEKLQENGDFWHWMERHFVGPLLAGGDVKMIFAGRIPPPWRRFEVRQSLTRLPLRPLDLEGASDALVLDVLTTYNPALDVEAQQSAVKMVNALAFGHPRLSEEIAVYLAPRWPPEDAEAFRVEVCRNVVKPFIEEIFFADVEKPWKEWLWWMSVLDWFDTTILPAYLRRVTPKKVEGKPDYFFIQEIGRLRVEKRVLWREERGDCMHGVIGEIVEQCLKTLNPERYQRANTAAAETFEGIAAQFDDDPGIKSQYEDQARIYRGRAENA